MSQTSTAVHFDNVNKFYGQFHALKDINLEVKKGERVVVCGPSGSGKSTLIRCINALETYHGGAITVFGTLLDDELKNVDDIRRDAGMVFQHFNLFPQMTVLENCTLAPMRVRGVSPSEAEKSARK